jgi:magnesium-transporting ATPase (P-type)
MELLCTILVPKREPMKRKLANLICVLLSTVPVLFLAVFYSKIASFPNTKVASQNGISVSKREFVYVIIFISVLVYYASYTLARKFNSLNGSGSGLRIFINSAFSLLTILLICFNMV